MENDLLIIETTVETKEHARSISAALIRARFAACCQISSPMTSVYYWEEKVCESTEYKITIKSLPHHYKAIETMIKSLHPYEVPEIIAYHSVCSLSSYADWVKEVCHV